MNNLLLDRYEVLEEAGTGGFASVMVAWDTRIERKVAIKIMKLSGASLEHLSPKDGSIQSVLLEQTTSKTATDAEKIDKTEGAGKEAAGKEDIAEKAEKSTSVPLEIPGLEEARMAAKLNDASIVSVYDFEVQGGYAYLILEYVEGLTLAEILAYYRESVTSDVIAAVFKTVSHALEIAHKKKVLHLDIKPENVLVDKQGKVKVTDFGLARFAGENGFGTAAGGTIGYMPPEQMKQEPLDERCDEWALASLTYEMITGTNPFLASSLKQAEKKIDGAEIIVPSLYLDDADESVDDILFCALDPDKNCRYDSVADFAHEMQQCLGSPRKGKHQLAAIVTQAEEQPEENEATPEDWPNHERRPFKGLSLKAQNVLMRIISAVSALFIAFVGASNIEPIVEQGWASPVPWIALAAAVALGAVFPSVGTALVLVFLGVVLCSHGLYLVGILFVACAIIWWVLSGRSSLEEAFPVIIVPLAGAVGLAPVAPYLASMRLRLPYALIATFFSFVLSFLFGCFGTASPLGWDVFSCLHILSTERFDISLQTLFFSPSTWFMLIAWLATAAVMVACGHFRKPWIHVLGIAAGVLLMAAALLVGAHFGIEAPSDSSPEINPANVASIILSGLLAAVISYVAPYAHQSGEAYESQETSEEEFIDESYE